MAKQHLAWDRHHVLYERSWYKTRSEKSLRTTSGLIVPMYWEPHHEGLHIDLDPPQKPTPRMVMGALRFLDELPSTDHVERVQHLADFFEKIGTSALDGSDVLLAYSINENLNAQLEYIKDGIYKGK